MLGQHNMHDAGVIQHACLCADTFTHACQGNSTCKHSMCAHMCACMCACMSACMCACMTCRHVCTPAWHAGMCARMLAFVCMHAACSFFMARSVCTPVLLSPNVTVCAQSSTPYVYKVCLLLYGMACTYACPSAHSVPMW